MMAEFFERNNAQEGAFDLVHFFASPTLRDEKSGRTRKSRETCSATAILSSFSDTIGWGLGSK
jgi:hypothetical protein